MFLLGNVILIKIWTNEFRFRHISGVSVFFSYSSQKKKSNVLNIDLYLMAFYECRWLIGVEEVVSYSAPCRRRMTSWLCFLLVREEHVTVTNVMLFAVLIKVLPVYPLLISPRTNLTLLLDCVFLVECVSVSFACTVDLEEEKCQLWLPELYRNNNVETIFAITVILVPFILRLSFVFKYFCTM